MRVFKKVLKSSTETYSPGGGGAPKLHSLEWCLRRAGTVQSVYVEEEPGTEVVI
jgi:hypothetical protein